MTKERRLAIEMWEAMREKVRKGEIPDSLAMLKAKLNWLREHDIDWYCECWFCNYFRKDIEDEEALDEEALDEDGEITSMTPKCPLNHHHPFRCDGRCEQYAIACNPKYPMEQRLVAIDNIIKALKGEYKE